MTLLIILMLNIAVAVVPSNSNAPVGQASPLYQDPINAGVMPQL